MPLQWDLPFPHPKLVCSSLPLDLVTYLGQKDISKLDLARNEFLDHNWWHNANTHTILPLVHQLAVGKWRMAPKRRSLQMPCFHSHDSWGGLGSSWSGQAHLGQVI